MSIENRKIDAVRELTTKEVAKVSGGTTNVFTPPPNSIPQQPQYKPLLPA